MSWSGGYSGSNCNIHKIGLTFYNRKDGSMDMYCPRCSRICPQCNIKFDILPNSDEYGVHLEEEQLLLIMETNNKLKKHMEYHDTHHTENDIIV